MNRAAVVGSPVRHSLSPVLHRSAYEACGLTDWRYETLEVPAGDLADLMLGMGPQWRGLSVTMPLKEEALLAADERSALALQVGAANTLVRREDGSWAADNTDVHGVVEALRPHTCASPEQATIIGSGATARAVLAALARLGVRDVNLVVREGARESTLAQVSDHGMGVQVHRMAHDDLSWSQAPILVNTTPAGGADRLAVPLRSRPAPAGQVVLDVVYAGWPTAFAAACSDAGALVISGIDMLIHQAAAQFTLMTGLPAPTETMERAGRRALEYASS
ncbi:shikimate dehydrogenase [Dermacoccaceae bacterium W4C1]